VPSRTSSARTRGTFERVYEAAVEVLLEPLAIEGEGEVRADCHQTIR